MVEKVNVRQLMCLDANLNYDELQCKGFKKVFERQLLGPVP
jgi:hypothetical protein